MLVLCIGLSETISIDQVSNMLICNAAVNIAKLLISDPDEFNVMEHAATFSAGCCATWVKVVFVGTFIFVERTTRSMCP